MEFVAEVRAKSAKQELKILGSKLLKARVQAPREAGKANRELITLLNKVISKRLESALRVTRPQGVYDPRPNGCESARASRLRRYADAKNHRSGLHLGTSQKCDPFLLSNINRSNPNIALKVVLASQLKVNAIEQRCTH